MDLCGCIDVAGFMCSTVLVITEYQRSPQSDEEEYSTKESEQLKISYAVGNEGKSSTEMQAESPKD